VILLGVAVIQSRLPKLSILRRRAEAESGV
jgi:hypothetical protein